MELSSQYCTFLVDGLLFGIEVNCVREVMREQPLTEVPLAPAVVGGLIHQRGQILTAIDLRERLGLTARARGTPFSNVVVQNGASLVSFLVDEIGDVVEVDPGISEPPPETLEVSRRELIKRVFKLEGQLLLILDAERTLAADSSTGIAKPAQRANGSHA